MSAASVVLPPLAITDHLPLGGPVDSVADTPAVDYEPFLADAKYHKTSPPKFLTLTEEQEAVYQEVLKHFVAEDYVIPGLKDEGGRLTEEEKFYLVRSPGFCTFYRVALRIWMGSDIRMLLEVGNLSTKNSRVLDCRPVRFLQVPSGLEMERPPLCHKARSRSQMATRVRNL